MPTATALRKTYSALVTSATKSESGSGPRGDFTAIVSVFGNVDYQGDRVMRGAFLDSLAKWRTSGDPIPVVESHGWDIDSFIGWADPRDVEEVQEGLLVKGHFDLTTAKGARAFELAQKRLLKEWSFAYDVISEKRAADGANELRRLDLIEVSLTMKGANPATRTVDVKSRKKTARRTKRENYADILLRANGITGAAYDEVGIRLRVEEKGRRIARDRARVRAAVEEARRPKAAAPPVFDNAPAPRIGPDFAVPVHGIKDDGPKLSGRATRSVVFKDAKFRGQIHPPITRVVG